MAKPVDFHMTGARCTHMALELEVIAYMRFHTDPSWGILAPTAAPSIPPRLCLLSLLPQTPTSSWVFCSSNSSAHGDCPRPQTQGIGNTCLSSWSSVWSPQLSVKVNTEYFFSHQAQHFHHNCWEIHRAFWSMPPDRGGQKLLSLLNRVFGLGNMVLLIL